MIVSVVSLYDTYLEGLFVRLTFTPSFSSVAEPLLWCIVPLVPRIRITEVNR